VIDHEHAATMKHQLSLHRQPGTARKKQTRALRCFGAAARWPGKRDL
jgi:hypothetical protein